MSGGATSVLRSLARVVSVALPEHAVVMSGTEGAFGRPCVGVVASTSLQSTPRGRRDVDLAQSFSVVAYPAEGLNPDSGLVEAQRVQEALFQALAVGIEPGRPHPGRLPVWDYRGVALYAPGPADPVRYARCEDVSLQSFSDPDDRWTVVADLRLRWSESVAPPRTGPLVVGVGARRAA